MTQTKETIDLQTLALYLNQPVKYMGAYPFKKTSNRLTGSLLMGFYDGVFSPYDFKLVLRKPPQITTAEIEELIKVGCIEPEDIDILYKSNITPDSWGTMHLATLKNMVDITNWLRRNGFDCDGLIEKGLAIDKTKM